MATEPRTKIHERSDANGKGVFVVVIGVLLGGLSLQGILGGFLGALKQQRVTTDQWEPVTRLKPGVSTLSRFPRLQVSPASDWQEFRAQEDAELRTYGWVDRTSGVVRIPIERAMDLVLAQGLPVRKDTDRLGPSSYQLIEGRSQSRERARKESK